MYTLLIIIGLVAANEHATVLQASCFSRHAKRRLGIYYPHHHVDTGGAQAVQFDMTFESRISLSTRPVDTEQQRENVSCLDRPT